MITTKAELEELFLRRKPLSFDPGWVQDGRGSLGKILSVLRKALDFLVIDGGKSAGELSAGIFEMADTLLLITNLNLC
jgi:hypothetical protein